MIMARLSPTWRAQDLNSYAAWNEGQISIAAKTSCGRLAAIMLPFHSCSNVKEVNPKMQRNRGAVRQAKRRQCPIWMGQRPCSSIPYAGTKNPSDCGSQCAAAKLDTCDII
jgi:hypothetical protein